MSERFEYTESAMKKCVCLFSGGIDSTTLMYHMRSEEYEVCGLGVDYGQRHANELTSAVRIAKEAGFQYHLLDLLPLSEILRGTALVDYGIPIPDGHYEAPEQRLTVVPNRNMILLSLAIGWATSLKADVAFGPHKGDRAIYPDCRPKFVSAIEEAARVGTDRAIEIHAPFLQYSKSDIIRRGAELGVPFEKTWTCYRGVGASKNHCGKCGACVERKEAFKLAGINDPTKYD